MESVTLSVASMTFLVESLPFKIWEKTNTSLVESLHMRRESMLSQLLGKWLESSIGIVYFNMGEIWLELTQF